MVPCAVKQAPNVRWLIAACAAALFALRAEPSWAAQYAGALPWDQTLGAIQDILVGPMAHAVITLNFAFSAILYVIGSERRAKSMLAAGLAACAGAVFVPFFSFLSPY